MRKQPAGTGSMTLDDLESFEALDEQCIHRMCTVHRVLKRSLKQIAFKLRKLQVVAGVVCENQLFALARNKPRLPPSRVPLQSPPNPTRQTTRTQHILKSSSHYYVNLQPRPSLPTSIDSLIISCNLPAIHTTRNSPLLPTTTNRRSF